MATYNDLETGAPAQETPTAGPHPRPLLEVIVHDAEDFPGLIALCAGYEDGRWRSKEFARHLMDWLPEFALTETERKSIGTHNAAELLRRAAHVVYSTEKYRRRGEFGELLLHAVIRQVFKTIPAITKIYYKTAQNETTKGFDAVHVVATQERLELWLGEAKFYEEINKAISDVVKELHDHSQTDYLRSEFVVITNMIDPSWPQAERLKQLIHPNTSLDKVFDALVVPVLLTYDSPTTGNHTALTEDYREKLRAEVLAHKEKFIGANPPAKLRIHLLLVPLKSKEELLKELHERLRTWQNL